MTLKLNGTNSEAAPAYAGDDADTGLQCGTNELKLVTGGSARATVDSSGRLGIASTSPDAELHVGGSEPHIDVGPDSGNRGKIGYKSNDLFFGTSSGTGEFIFKNNVTSTDNPADSGTERMRIFSGGGITFNGDTAAANALDDYEEGTWTPAFSCTSANFSYSDQSGIYTKIGNIVTINFRLQIVSRTAGTGALNISGLPFTPTSSRCVCCISPTFGSYGTNNSPVAGFGDGGVGILLKKYDSSEPRGNADTNVDPSLITTAGLIGTMSYRIS